LDDEFVCCFQELELQFQQLLEISVKYFPGAQPPLYSDVMFISEGQNPSIPDDSLIYVANNDNSCLEGSNSNLNNKRRSVADWRRCVYCF